MVDRSNKLLPILIAIVVSSITAILTQLVYSPYTNDSLAYHRRRLDYYNTSVEAKTGSRNRCHHYAPPQMNVLGASSPFPFGKSPVLPISVRSLDQL
jgi:hypothetical protein